MLFFASALCVLNAQEKKEKIEQLEEVVVSATKFETKKEHVGKIIYQITSEELENLKGKTVTDVLSSISSFSIRGANSSSGKTKETYIRGGRDRQVLVLIDGIPVSDPTSINTTFDLRLLNLSQVESIEVMNGAASTLYGSGAATGVINIVLKKGAKEPFSMSYEASLSTSNTPDDKKANFNDVDQNISFNGTLGKLSYLVSGSLTKSGGMSMASDKLSTTPFEEDEYNAENAFVRLGYNFSDKLSVNIFANIDENKYDFDAGPNSDSDINFEVDKQKRFGFASTYKYNKGILKLTASYNKNNRDIDQFNSWAMVTDNYLYIGESYAAELVNNYKVSNNFQLITGINYVKQNNETVTPWGNIDTDIAEYKLIDPYVSALYITDFGLNLSGGIRLNNHSEYGNHFVYNINPSYNVSENLKILASYSTAYITPSTYQLFSSYGNTELDPEEDKTIEAGLTYNAKMFEVNSVFFYREEENAIILPFFVQYHNADETIYARGLETEVKINAIDDVTFRLGHTYTNKSSDVDYIPDNKITAMVETTVLDNTYLSLQFKNISERTYYDQWGTGSDIEIDAYNVLDFYGSYEVIKDRLTVFGNVSNIFNEDYVETIGFTTKGRNLKVGLNFNF